MRFTCPHCEKSFEVNLGSVLGARRTAKKAEASRLNGDTGGRPKKQHPVRLRPHHEGHPGHAKWKAEQEKLGRQIG